MMYQMLWKRVGDEEELLRRTQDLLGAKEMEGKRYYLWRKHIHDSPPAYRNALEDAESRKCEAVRGLPEAQISKTWAHYLMHQFKEMKKAYANRPKTS